MQPPTGTPKPHSSPEACRQFPEAPNPLEIPNFPEGCQSPESYMRLALQLARKGEGRTSPNPMVGCVAVKNGRIIAAGYHEAYGGFHAERNALLHCQEDPSGADLYVNLEPCCHHGKTPPCTDIIIESKIRKVYVGCLDSNPKVAGKGIRILQEHGISTEIGILEAECRALNEVFFHFMEQKMPFLAMKYAMTLDGKIACETGDSKWVTGEESRSYVQSLRNRYRGIMAGIGTVLADDPLLNCRMEGGKDPVRIICDARLRIPLDSQIVKTAPQTETILAYSPQAALDWRKQLTEAQPPAGESNHSLPASLNAAKEVLGQHGITLLEIPLLEIPGSGTADAQPAHPPKNIALASLQALPQTPIQPQLDLQILLEQLAQRRIDSILLEGGGILNASALTGHFVQRVYAFIAPKLIAGENAKSPIEGIGIARMSDAIKLKEIETRTLGEDICVSGRVVYA